MNFFVYIIIAGIIQSYILVFFLLLSKRGNKKANRILGILILFFSTTMNHFVFYALGVYNNYPHLLLIFEPLIFTYGPLFLFYERTLTSKNYSFSKTRFLHFIPLLVCFAFYTPFYLRSTELKSLFLSNYQLLIDIARNVEIVHIIQMFIYLLIINFDLKKYHNRILKSYSSLEKINLNWLRLMVFLFMAVYAVVVVVLIFELLGFREFANIYGTKIIGVLIALCVYYIGYRGLFQPEIFIAFENDESEKKPLDITYTGNLEVEINEPIDEEKIKKLLDFMQEKKPYLKEDLTLPDLASQMGVSRNQLSSLINDGIGENFFMFINKYRVEEVKLQLVNPVNKNYTIMAIAYDAGFRSKSSFNNIFKKFTNKTPTEYRSSLTYEDVEALVEE